MTDRLTGGGALTRLNLGYQKSTVVMGGRPNRIGDAGVAALARMLATNRTLVALNLNKNQVTRVGAGALGRALASNRSLRVLELRANYQLGDDGVVDLLDAMATNDTLAALDLVGCQVGLVGLRRLLRHVETHPNLVSVHLGGWKTRRTDENDDGGDEGNVEDDGSAHDVARRVMEQVKANRDRHGDPAQRLFNSVGRCYGGKRVETWLDDIRSIYRVPKTDHTDADADVQPKPTAKKEVKRVRTKVNNNIKSKGTTTTTTTDTTPAGATVKPGLRLSVESCLRTRLLNQLRHNQELAARLAVEEDKNDITGSDASFAWAKALPGEGLRAALQQAMAQGKRLKAMSEPRM